MKGGLPHGSYVRILGFRRCRRFRLVCVAGARLPRRCIVGMQLLDRRSGREGSACVVSVSILATC